MTGEAAPPPSPGASQPFNHPPERPIAAAPTTETPAPPPLPPQVVRNNHRLGVANGVLFAFGDSLTSASPGEALLVGSLAPIGLLPQLLVGGRLRAKTCVFVLARLDLERCAGAGSQRQ